MRPKHGPLIGLNINPDVGGAELVEQLRHPQLKSFICASKVVQKLESYKS